MLLGIKCTFLQRFCLSLMLLYCYINNKKMIHKKTTSVAQLHYSPIQCGGQGQHGA